VFDYLGMPVRFGSNLDRDTGAGLIEDINAVLPHPLPKTLSGDTLAEARDQAAADQQAEPESQPSAMVAPTATPAGRTSLWLPLGVLLLDWSVGDIMLLFWLKSAIVGFFNILKMFRIVGPMAIFYSLFIIGHFGAFMAVHLMFIFSLFIDSSGQSASLAEVVEIFRRRYGRANR
jgi:hypothetical protein